MLRVYENIYDYFNILISLSLRGVHSPLDSLSELATLLA